MSMLNRLTPHSKMQTLYQVSVFYSPAKKAYYVKHCKLGDEGPFGERFEDMSDAVVRAKVLSNETDAEYGMKCYGFSPSPPRSRSPTDSAARSRNTYVERQKAQRQALIERARYSAYPVTVTAM